MVLVELLVVALVALGIQTVFVYVLVRVLVLVFGYPKQEQKVCSWFLFLRSLSHDFEYALL